MIRTPGRARSSLLVLAILTATLPVTARAQSRPRLTVEVAAGWVGFADDAIVSESMVAGAFRWYLTPRLSVGPEIVYIDGSNHSHLVVTGNVTYDLLSQSPAQRRVMPFVVGGGGLYQTRQEFPTGGFTSSEGAFTAGGGVRVRAADRVTLGIDTRIGWELHVRVNGFVGFVLP